MRHQGSMQASGRLEEIALSDDNFTKLAERELAAFVGAVIELFGPEQASLSTAEWIDELESADWQTRPGVSELRRISITASAKLAHRKVFRPRMRPGAAAISSRSDQL